MDLPSYDEEVKHHTLHQYRRELSTSGNQILALIPHELPISMNALPSSPGRVASPSSHD